MSTCWKLHRNQLIVSKKERMPHPGRGQAGLRGKELNILRPEQYVHWSANLLTRSQISQLTLNGIPLPESGKEICLSDELRY